MATVRAEVEAMKRMVISMLTIVAWVRMLSLKGHKGRMQISGWSPGGPLELSQGGS